MGQVLCKSFRNVRDSIDALQSPIDLVLPGGHCEPHQSPAHVHEEIEPDSEKNRVAPFLELNMGQYTLHPRLRSLTVRQVDEAEDPVNEHINAAETLFLKDLHTLETPKSSVWISYIENKMLEERFNQKRAEFQKQGLNSEVLLYHGTSSANADGICKTNFRMDLSVRFAHGRGIYLSKYPTVSLQYGEELIVCKVLLGRKQSLLKDPGPFKDCFDSKECRLPKGHTKMMGAEPTAFVVRSVEQILPYCIISAEYPEAVEIGTRKSTVQSVQRAQQQIYNKIWK